MFNYNLTFEHKKAPDFVKGRGLFLISLLIRV